MTTRVSSRLFQLGLVNSMPPPIATTSGRRSYSATRREIQSRGTTESASVQAIISPVARAKPLRSARQ